MRWNSFAQRTVVAVTLTLCGLGAAAAQNTAASSGVTILSGRGNGPATIVEKDGTVRVLKGRDLQLNNQPTQRLLEGNAHRAEQAAETAKQLDEKRAQRKAAQAEAAKSAEEQALTDAKQRDEEKKKQDEDAKKLEQKTVQLYVDKADTYVPRPDSSEQDGGDSKPAADNAGATPATASEQSSTPTQSTTDKQP